MQLDFFMEVMQDNKNEDCDTLFCRKCNQSKHFSEFSPSYAESKLNPIKYKAFAGTAAYCSDCSSNYYKIKNAAKKAAPSKPALPHACDCCGDVITDNQMLHFDHDHITGTFRGWVCRRCNTGIGNLGDTIEGLQNAIEYLKRTSNE